MVDQAKMQTQRKCSICGGLGHNSRGCTARPGTVAAPPASEGGVASERTLKRAHSGEEELSSESDTEQSVQRKERKRGEETASALGVLPTFRSIEGSQCSDWALLLRRQPVDGGRAPQISCRAQKARKGQSVSSPLKEAVLPVHGNALTSQGQRAMGLCQ